MRSCSRSDFCFGRACSRASFSERAGREVDIVRSERYRQGLVPSIDAALQGNHSLSDGKVLADFAVFLHDQKEKEAALALWKLENAFAIPEELTSGEVTVTIQALLESLRPCWEKYLSSPAGLGNFDDATEWAKHDLPAVHEKVSDSGKHYVDSEDAHYPFAVAAMIGVHVSVVCSEIIGHAVSRTAGITGIGLEAQWASAFDAKHIQYTEVLKNKCRTFIIPQGGSAYSPATILPDQFVFRELCPELFASLRRSYGVPCQDYFNSLCRLDFEFISFGTNSKSGECFFFSHDSRYLLKTTSTEEANTLCMMLPNMCDRFTKTPQSLIGKYMGLYELTLKGQKPRLFFIMLNTSAHSYEISRGYDIKGSTKNRDAPDDFIGKDMDFLKDICKLGLPLEVSQDLAATHREDADLLQIYGIMDYSLLVQVHDSKGLLGTAKAKQNRKGFVQLIDCKKPGKDLSGWVPQEVHKRVSHSNSFGFHDESAPAGDSTWRPGTGIWSKDGRFLFTFGLIDILCPFSVIPKIQYAFEQVASFGNGNAYSRVPPDFYHDRQVNFVHDICGLRDA